jgi:hypothetical protein
MWPWQRKKIEIEDDNGNHNIRDVIKQRRIAERKLATTVQNGHVVKKVAKEAEKHRMENEFGQRIANAYGRPRHE